MSIKNYVIAFDDETKKIELAKIKKQAQALEYVDVVMDSYDVTDQVLKVVAKYFKENGLQAKLTEFGTVAYFK